MWDGHMDLQKEMFKTLCTPCLAVGHINLTTAMHVMSAYTRLEIDLKSGRDWALDILYCSYHAIYHTMMVHGCLIIHLCNTINYLVYSLVSH